MRAFQFHSYGGPEVLQLVETDEPHAGAGQVRIAVRATGVNPVDWKVREGLFGADPSSLPKIPGVDVAGIVDEVGEGVEATVGEEVVGFAIGGANAEFTLLQDFIRKPATSSWAEAAVLPIALETTGRVFELLTVAPGQTMVITGAAGGVGVFAVQLAVARGITVIGTAGAANQDFLEGLGAIPVTYGEGMADRIKAAAPEGVDVAFDAAGKGVLPELIALTGSRDQVVTIADGDAAKHGVRFTGGAAHRSTASMNEGAALIDVGRMRVPLAHTYPFEQLPEAQRVSQTGHVRGKIAITLP
jgi:NADPH:quinone reductase-like Zn-dependent oxidoreductase